MPQERTGEKGPHPASSKLEEEQQAQAFIRAIYRAQPRLCQPTSQPEVFLGTLSPTRWGTGGRLLMVKMRCNPNTDWGPDATVNRTHG